MRLQCIETNKLKIPSTITIWVSPNQVLTEWNLSGRETS